MSESNFQQNSNKLNDEIDIFEFSSRIWNAFKKFLIDIMNIIIFVIILIIRKSLWIISFALLGVIMGYTFYSLKKPYYTSMLEGTSGGVDNTVVIDHVNKLSQMVGKHELLKKHLGMDSVEYAKKIHSINAFYGIDVNGDGRMDFIDEKEIYNPKDTMQNRIPSVFFIKLTLYDEDILPKLREGLLNYINGNAYIQELFDIDKKQKIEMIEFLTKEITKIDTIQYIIRSTKRSNREMGGNFFVMGSEPEIKLFYTDILELSRQKQELQKNIDISKQPVIIVQDFTSAQYEEKKVTYYIIWFGRMMAVFGLVCAILWQYRKKLWKLIVENQTSSYIQY